MDKEYKKLLIISNSRSGSTNKLCAEALVDIKNSNDLNIVTYSKDSLTANAQDVINIDAIILGSSENFGYMSGAMKVFLENIYYEVIERKRGLPFGIIIKAGTSGIGAYNGIKKITDAMGWKEALEPLIVVGKITEIHLKEARLFGQTLAAGLDLGIY